LQCRSWFCKQTGKRSGTRRIRLSLRFHKDSWFQESECASFWKPSDELIKVIISRSFAKVNEKARIFGDFLYILAKIKVL